MSEPDFPIVQTWIVETRVQVTMKAPRPVEKRTKREQTLPYLAYAGNFQDQMWGQGKTPEEAFARLAYWMSRNQNRVVSRPNIQKED